MNVILDPAVIERTPGFALGFLHYEGVSLGESPKMLRGRINLFVESLRLEHTTEAITEIKGVREWRAAFKKLGVDPSRYRPSSEALLRRLLQGNPFFWVNSAVDINNFLSVHHALPLGIYDAQTVNGTITCRLGTSSDSYTGLNGREMEMKDKLLLADEIGAFGSPIVDSVRTKVTESSTSLVQFIFFHEGLDKHAMDQILGSAARMFTEINGGEVVSQKLISSTAL